MPGRRAFPYSVEAEEQAAPLPGRRKARWRDRPRRFNDLYAAGTFAARRAAANGRRQHVRPEQTPFGVMYFVREREAAMTLRLAEMVRADEQRFAARVGQLLDAQLRASLNRMEREA